LQRDFNDKVAIFADLNLSQSSQIDGKNGPTAGEPEE
jgi:hypothetical protein